MKYIGNRKPLIINMPGKTVLSMADLEKEAGVLSSFDGNDQRDDFVDFMGQGSFDYYDGEGDDFVDFAGNKVAFNNQNQRDKDRRFKVTITNGNNTDEVFKLASGLGSTAGLPLADGAFNSVGANALSIAGVPTNWQYFLNFYKSNPVQIQALFIESDKEAQLSTTIDIKRHTPFRASLQSTDIDLSGFSNEMTIQTKKVTVDAEILFDHQQEITMTIVANSTMTITFYGGAVLNSAKALAKKIMKANNFQDKRMTYGNVEAAKNRRFGTGSHPLLPQGVGGMNGMI